MPTSCIGRWRQKTGIVCVKTGKIDVAASEILIKFPLIFYEQF